MGKRYYRQCVVIIVFLLICVTLKKLLCERKYVCYFICIMPNLLLLLQLWLLVSLYFAILPQMCECVVIIFFLLICVILKNEFCERKCVCNYIGIMPNLLLLLLLWLLVSLYCVILSQICECVATAAKRAFSHYEYQNRVNLVHYTKISDMINIVHVLVYYSIIHILYLSYRLYYPLFFNLYILHKSKFIYSKLSSCGKQKQFFSIKIYLSITIILSRWILVFVHVFSLVTHEQSRYLFGLSRMIVFFVFYVF